MDGFLTTHFDNSTCTILNACINDYRLRFVVEINKTTMLETEASRTKRKEASKAMRESMTPNKLKRSVKRGEYIGMQRGRA